MFELDAALAGQIVQRTMAILPFNINVMDAQGRIIASGDPERLQTVHEGARQALARQGTVELDARSAADLPGAQPGVNLPLRHHDQILGVLGITGAPARIRPYAELVRMTAEMLVEHRGLQAEHHWHQQRCDTLAQRLLSGPPPDAGLREEAGQLGLQPELPRQACLIELAESAAADALPRLAALLRQTHADAWCLPLSPRLLLCCRPPEARPAPARLPAWLEARESGALLRLAVTDPAPGLAPLREACAAARELLAWGRAHAPRQRLLRLADHRLDILLYRQRHDWQVGRLAATLSRLDDQDDAGPLRATLQAWFDHDGSPSACAQALGIHRNSLRYRLGRIRDATGLDAQRPAQAAELYLALRAAALAGPA